jgi:glycosyltransferase involved in cell wall biosynthesis
LRVVHDGLPFNPGTVDRAAARRTFSLPEDAIVIGSLGHLSPVKGFDLLIEAFSRIASEFPKAFLLIAGGDILGDRQVRLILQKQIADLGLNERIHLPGALDTRQGFFSCMDLFAVASRTEGFSLSLVEAMQHGLPSVVTSSGGCTEAARPEKEALRFTSGNTLDLAEKLKELINNPELRLRLGEAARKRAQSYLTLTRCAQEYHQVYKEALTKH